MNRIVRLLAISVCASICLSVSMQTGASTREERQREARQKQLDQRCEKARQKALTPLKEKFTRECIDEGRDADYCQKRHADYGKRTGKRPPLFYDLPECVEAFEFKKSYRQGE
jgi:hypothetical protein